MEHEAFYVLEGVFSFPYASKETEVGKGQLINVPRGEFHTYKNIGKLLVIISPPQFEKFFGEIGIPVNDKSSFQPLQITAVIENVVKTTTRYGLIRYMSFKYLQNIRIATMWLTFHITILLLFPDFSSIQLSRVVILAETN